MPARTFFAAVGLPPRALRRSAAAILLLAPLTACLLGPDFKKPLAPVAEHFLKAGGPVLADSEDYRAIGGPRSTTRSSTG